MTTPIIIERQNIVRAWWLEQATNPLLLKMLTATWHRQQTLDVHMERWMDMHARVSCFEHGRLLANNNVWKLITDQIQFPVLWLVKNWHLTNVKKVSKAMLSRYHILGRRNSNLVLIPAPILIENISADPDELYEWLGVIGGDIPATPPMMDDEEDTS